MIRVIHVNPKTATMLMTMAVNVVHALMRRGSAVTDNMMAGGVAWLSKI